MQTTIPKAMFDRTTSRWFYCTPPKWPCQHARRRGAMGRSPTLWRL